jgi:hypothetical protein
MALQGMPPHKVFRKVAAGQGYVIRVSRRAEGRYWLAHAETGRLVSPETGEPVEDVWDRFCTLMLESLSG